MFGSSRFVLLSIDEWITPRITGNGMSCFGFGFPLLIKLFKQHTIGASEMVRLQMRPLRLLMAGIVLSALLGCSLRWTVVDENPVIDGNERKWGSGSCGRRNGYRTQVYLMSYFCE